MNRWSVYHDGVPYEDSRGEWVHYSDASTRIAELEAENKELRDFRMRVETTPASVWAQECAALRLRAEVAERALTERGAE